MDGKDRPDWNKYKQIFADHWEGFKQLYPKYNTEYYECLVNKMLSCGDPEQMGYIEYKCLHCGCGKRKVCMSCKSTLCLRCGKVYVDDWVSQVSKILHKGLIYRHITLTMPDRIGNIFYNHEELLGPFMRCGAHCLDDFFSYVSGKEIKGGYIEVLQTHGRNGEYNVHLHIIATSGGLDEEAQKWIHLDYLPYKVLHKKWEWYLLEMLRKEMDTEEIEKVVDDCYKKYPKGFVAHVQRGDVPGRYKSLATYLAKYVVSPPISVRRIESYDGHRVRYWYRSHMTDKIEKERVNVYTFIGRMIQHVLPKGFKRIRYYGVQATKTFEKIKGIIQEALTKIKKVVQDGIKIIEKKNYRERYQESTGKDPCLCPECGKEMDIWEIWHPSYGVIYRGYEEVKGNKYESREEKVSLGKRNGKAVRAPTKGAQLSLFGVWDGASC